ncbi:DUF927 domain-containing protein [Turicibacter sanguinis]|uniref:DUF927 domain-containing protein n=1 Tax=Turicibacter sanguinis TaxID=154288 RepID=UPI00232F0F3B|nr:DUF927 domain-containing protein [Turicibacter sanguinis]MDB8545254.1 DUF927 domain-containing protein [Turicibacter sanguinis]
MSSSDVRTIYDNVEYSPIHKAVIKWIQHPDDPTQEFPVKIAGPMQVVSTIEEIDTDNVSVEICFKVVSNQQGNVKRIITTLDTISSANLIESLAKQGLDVNSKNKYDLIKFFRLNREDKPLYFKHKTLGFGWYNGKPYFKHYQTIRFKALKKCSHESNYEGMFNIAPTGSLEEWESIIRNYVLTNPTLELALILGFSASLVGYIGNPLGLESFLFHIFGDSSTGKTTACYVATASFGSPNTRQKGLISSWNATANALYGKISNNHGVPIVFDECSLAKFNDFTGVIYSIGEGREKDRMTVELDLRDTRTWMTSVISTGEKSLFEGSKSNTGLKVRLIEFDNVQWTDNANQSEAIKKGLSKNFGHAWKPFVEHLLNFSVNDLGQQLDGKVQEANSMLPKSQITDRLAKKVGMLFLTIDLCEDALGFKLQKNAIKELIVEHVSKNINTSDIATKAYLDLMEYVTINHQFFERKWSVGKNDMGSFPMGSYYGRLTFSGIRSEELKEVEILTTKFTDILGKEYGYESPKTIISEFKKRGWLDCEKDKTYRKRKVNGIKNQNVHVIKVPVVNATLGINENDVTHKALNSDSLVNPTDVDSLNQSKKCNDFSLAEEDFDDFWID